MVFSVFYKREIYLRNPTVKCQFLNSRFNSRASFSLFLKDGEMRERFSRFIARAGRHSKYGMAAPTYQQVSLNCTRATLSRDWNPTAGKFTLRQLTREAHAVEP